MAAFKTYIRKAYMMGARYTGLSSLLSPLLSGIGAMLMLHHVGREQGGIGLNRHLHVTPEFLERLIERLKADGAVFVSQDEAVDRLRSGHADERFLSVTLDDGYRDNLQYAAPVFRAHDVPYTIFIAPGLTDGTADLWWEHLELVVEREEQIAYETADGAVTLECRTPRQKRYAFCVLLEHATEVLDEDEQRVFSRQLSDKYGIDRDAHFRDTLLTWEEIASFATDRLASIGAHTVNHFHLRRLPRERALEECVRSADMLEQRLGLRPAHFAFPYGNALAVGPREVEIAREAGFASAVTTRHGVLMPGHAEQLHALPRISVNGYYQRVSYVQTMLTGITVPAANYGRTLVTV
jgi:peptidoglycan/xylan/chitin deacetylase (PgdA/CDA1 family)